jgi:hypothetical protein
LQNLITLLLRSAHLYQNSQIKMQTEQEYFQAPYVRAQLITTGTKQDTYYASMGGKPVFVKGPYEKLSRASCYNRVTSLKRVLDPSTPAIKCELVELSVDCEFLGTQFGARTGFTTGSKGYFQVFEDILRDETSDVLPTISKTSKMWSVPVQVVDFSKIKQVSHLEYSPVWEKSVYVKAPAIALQVVKQLLLCWIIGTSADLAKRNFLIKNGVCYQVDFEKIHDYSWVMTQTCLCSPKTKALGFTSRFSKLVWESELEPFTKTLLENSEKLNGIIDDSVYAEMRKRIEKIQTLEGLLEAYSEQKRLKRSRVE